MSVVKTAFQCTQHVKVWPLN